MTELQKLEIQHMELTEKLTKLRRDSAPVEIPNYTFEAIDGKITLLELFAGKETLFLIHNMGQGCRYCTLWGDGLNGFLPHLESQFSVVMASKDNPQTQRAFANSRGWRFRMVSHGGGSYITEQTVTPGETNMPGLVCYLRNGEKVFRKNATAFGPGDEFCSMWNLLSMAGISTDNWTPQFNYWKRPEKMDDGGQNLT